MCLPDNRRDWLGGEVPWKGCGLQGFAPMSFPVGLWITGPRSWWRSVIFLTALNLSKRLAVLAWALHPLERACSHWERQLAHGGPLCGTQAWLGEEALGRTEQAVRQDWLPRQRVDSVLYSIVELFVIVAKTQGWRDEEDFALGLGWWKLFPSLCHSAWSCVTSPMPNKGSACHQPSPPWGKMV